jgi:putative transposase
VSPGWSTAPPPTLRGWCRSRGHPGVERALLTAGTAALCMAIAVRGGSVAGVIFHSDYAEVCVKPRICGDGLCSWELLVDFSA